MGNALERVGGAHHMALHRACGNAVAAELAQAVVGDSAGLVGKVWGW